MMPSPMTDRRPGARVLPFPGPRKPEPLPPAPYPDLIALVRGLALLGMVLVSWGLLYAGYLGLEWAWKAVFH